MEFVHISSIVSASLTFILALIAWLNRQHEKVNIAFMIVMLSEAFAGALTYLSHTFSMEQFTAVMHIFYVQSLFSFFAIVYYILVLTGYNQNMGVKILGVRVRDFILFLLIGSLPIEILLQFTNVLATGIQYHESHGFVITWSKWMFVVELFAVVGILYVIAILVHALRSHPQGARKRFIQWNTAGIIILIGSGPVLGILLPMTGIPSDPLVDASIIISSVIFYLAINRYQFDVIQEMNIGLEDLVERRTEHLRNAQVKLLQSEKMASLNRLVAGIAHEINTPAGAIYSSYDTLTKAIQKLRNSGDESWGEEFKADREIARSLQALETTGNVIRDGSIRITDIVNRMKRFSKLDEAELQMADVNSCIIDAIAVFSHDLKPGITIRPDLPDLPKVSCYPARLNQMILLLFENAIHAIDSQGEIIVRTKHFEEQIQIIVQDTGKGIPLADQSKIFEPGFTSWGVGVGVGFGLSICYRVVQEHHGSITVDSEEGKGATFIISFPDDLETRVTNHDGNSA